MKYRVFSRKVYRRENGRYVPNPGARRMTVDYVQTVQEARRLCAQGPANIARDEGREYRNLPFYEFESVGE